MSVITGTIRDYSVHDPRGHNGRVIAVARRCRARGERHHSDVVTDTRRCWPPNRRSFGIVNLIRNKVIFFLD